jgi:transcription initiation factor TFIIF subunit alpha
LQKLLTSDEDSDEEKSDHKDDESDEEKNKKPEDAPKEAEGAKSEKPAKEKKKDKDDKKSRMQKFHDAMNQKPGTGNASDFSSDSEDESTAETSKKSKKKKQQQHLEKGSHNSRSGTPSDSAAKRKAEITNSSDNSNSPQSTPAKKARTESSMAPSTSFANYSSSKDSFGNTEDAVRRYLVRKPMTTTELLKKIQSKKTGVSRDELVDMMTQILKKINPSKQMIQGKMYLSLKAT